MRLGLGLRPNPNPNSPHLVLPLGLQLLRLAESELRAHRADLHARESLGPGLELEFGLGLGSQLGVEIGRRRSRLRQPSHQL